MKTMETLLYTASTTISWLYTFILFTFKKWEILKNDDLKTSGLKEKCSLKLLDLSKPSLSMVCQYWKEAYPAFAGASKVALQPWYNSFRLTTQVPQA